MIDKLNFLIALAQEQHFGRAAAACGVTQPTLSAGIKQLEGTLGVLLVQRGSRFHTFTPEGQRTLEWARRIVGDARAMREEIRALKQGLAGHIRIAAVPTALAMVATLATPYRARHPNVSFTVLSRNSIEILGLLENLEIDAGLTYLDNGQNNVQGACDMGSFPHELSGYRHISDAATRELFEKDWGVHLDPEPGLRIPNMLDAAVDGSYRGIYIQGEDILQSDPDTHHVAAGLAAMECVVVQDLFLNETARYAHVFLPGSTFLEKDGTFINAERRIGRVRKVMAPRNGLADWEITVAIAKAMGMEWDYAHPSEIMDEIARLTPTFAGVSYTKLDEAGSVQWPCNDQAPEGTPIMHIGSFVRGKGNFLITEYVPTDEKIGPRFPLLLTTGRILSQYNVGAQTRRTENVVWHEEDRLEIHPHDAEERGIRDGDWVRLRSRAGETSLRSRVTDRVAPGVVYTTFHHPDTQANVITTDYSDWATNCPEYKVTAVQVSPSNGPSQWQESYQELSRQTRRIAPVEAAE